MAKRKSIPFEFVLESLAVKNPLTKPMFGAHGVYVDGKIVFILRDRETNPKDNGVWVATVGEHHKSLKKALPSLRSIEMFGPGPTGWQILPMSSKYFESSVEKACAMVLQNDERIGKYPKPKSKRKKR